MRAPRVISAILALALIAACGKDETPRDITLTPAVPDSQAVLRDAPPPAANDAAKQPVKQAALAPPKAPAAVPTPIPKAPPITSVAFGTIAAGTEIGVRPGVKACTNTHKVGDRITGTVAEAVPGSGGASIPPGAAVTIEVTESTYGKNGADNVKFAFKVVSLSWSGNTYDLTAPADVIAPPVTKVRRQSTGTQATKVGTGAAIGAVIGQVAGKDTKSTVIGAAVGAIGGAAVAAGTADYDGCVAAEARLSAKLVESLRVRV